MSDRRIADVRVTPIAFRDPPLLNVKGCHEPWCLRSIIEVELENGTIGLGESYGGKTALDALAGLAPRLVGLAVTDLNGLRRLASETVADGQGEMNREQLLPRVIGAFEVALWDALGKVTNMRVCDLLGGQVRDRVPFAAYLFYKFAGHHGQPADAWGEALSPETMVEQTRRMIELHGFGSLKLKAGVLEPDAEIATLEALRDAFPSAPLRIDPNGGWHVHTTLDLLPRLEPLLEYLEDPTLGIPEMAVVQRATSLPLATNMCVVADSHLPPGVAQGAVKVILSDHHYWGGLQASRELARICEIWGLGLSMHSNSHLGISLMAMTHLAAATPNLTYACDTHYPWQEDEVVEGGRFTFENGSLAVPDGPGLGVTLDRDALARLRQNYLSAGILERDDAGEMRKHWPDWRPGRPRF